MIEEFLLGFGSGIAANSLTEAFKRAFAKTHLQNEAGSAPAGFQTIEEYSDMKLLLLELMEDLSVLAFTFDLVGRFNKAPGNFDIQTVGTISDRVHRDILSMEQKSPFGFRLFCKELAFCAKKYSLSSVPDAGQDIVDPYVFRLITELHNRNVGAFAYAFQMQRVFSGDEAINILELKARRSSKRLSKTERDLLVQKASAVFIISSLLRRAAQSTLFKVDIFQPE